MNDTTQTAWGEGALRSVPSGLRDLDRLLNGFHASDLLILGGLPAMATALATSIAFDVARSHAVAFFSLRPEDHSKLIGARQQREGLSLHINGTPAMSIAGLRAQSRLLKEQVGLDLIVVDCLQNLCGSDDDGGPDVWAMIDRLKAIAKELDVPVIALSQPQFFEQLREHHHIWSMTDVEMFVSETAEVIVTKQRGGPIGRVKLHFDVDTGRFSEGEK